MSKTGNLLQQGIQFDVKLLRPCLPDIMSVKELDRELEKRYQDILAGRTTLAGQVFANIRKEYGL